MNSMIVPPINVSDLIKTDPVINFGQEGQP